jgi:response regulator RpfG family c-di-GMP phosphodiesterase
MISVLLCDQNKKWLDSFSTKLKENMVLSGAVSTGKQAQELLNSKEVDVLVINIATKSYSFFEVVKFVKQKKPKTLIIMVAESKRDVEDYFYNPNEIKKLGIVESFVKPFPIFNLINFIDQSFKHKQWGKISDFDGVVNENYVEKEESMSDRKFTSLEAEVFCQNNVCIFDLFVRIGKNKYIKVFNCSESIDRSRIEKYLKKDPKLHLYFKTEDRLSYVNFSNQIIKRKMSMTIGKPKELFDIVDTTTKLVVDEIYSRGLPTSLIEESNTLCNNIYDSISYFGNLKKLLFELLSEDESEKAHVSLTSFFTAIICNNLEWVTEHSRGNIIMGSLLHDLGKVKLSTAIRTKKVSQMNERELAEYKRHPEFGVNLLDSVTGISEQVKQIVYQHHEVNTGEGFPNELTGIRIYPLAKIIAFANFLAGYCMEHKLNPLDAIKSLMVAKDDIMKYDSEVIKAFLRGFIKGVD